MPGWRPFPRASTPWPAKPTARWWGGDTTRGDTVVLSITVLGEVRRSHALRRDAARVGDDVWVSGSLGAADLALRLVLGQLPPDPERLRATRPALDRPMPRLKLGRYLASVAHAAIDVSDGLVADLGHIADDDVERFLPADVRHRLPSPEDLALPHQALAVAHAVQLD